MQFRYTAFSPALVILVGMLVSCAEHPSAPVHAPGRLAPQAVSISPGVPTRILSRTQRTDLSTRSGAGVGILASTSAVTFRRSPAEGGGPTDMAVGGTAYFRDVLWEADYTITATNDGDFWDSSITFPSGAVAQFGTVTWHASFAGQSDCFVSGFAVLCGSTSADARDMVSNQCGASGSYTYRLNQNGAQVFSGTFTLKPTLPPGTVANQFQTDHRLDPYDSICKDAAGNSIPCPGTPDQVPQTIKDKGCALTAAVMLLGYFGIPTDPVTLNAYLLSLGAGGYTPRGGVNWEGLLQRFAQQGQFRSVRINASATPADLRSRICRFGPQIVYVKNRQHFVLVTGLNDGETDFTIADPAAPPGTPGKTGLLNADYGGFRSVREFAPLSQPSLEDAILATLHSPAQLLVTDPLGRRIGHDPLRGITYGEIPSASYDSSGLGDLQDDGTIVDVDPESKELYIPCRWTDSTPRPSRARELAVTHSTLLPTMRSTGSRVSW